MINSLNGSRRSSILRQVLALRAHKINPLFYTGGIKYTLDILEKSGIM